MKTITFNTTIPAIAEQLTKPIWERVEGLKNHYVWWLIKEWDIKIEIRYSEIYEEWVIEYLNHSIRGSSTLAVAKENAWQTYCMFSLLKFKGVTNKDLGEIDENND